ncbi:FAD-dependent oxidoreductase [Phytoactinopolyspora alkaliphila]|uniref:FAD-dependent oxidoreductase n=1 Tax=Phytoactinopolyspora alkaliphila TaxID=1783498 RepID=A0A6N9YSA4_9ACTN|nr:FAD-dependent oxidoreductase [Phytoactinopolyspora alkaliphila]NED97923.1 FAD-dependent oxidoreductase [Phytoactinopolyspora alkaliphila]
MKFFQEEARHTPIASGADVIVCGGGPAGFAAAVAAARTGAKTVLLEAHGCLGGVWTSGALSWIIEADKPGILSELTETLDSWGARAGGDELNFGYDVEAMKYVLDEISHAAGIQTQLHTRVVSAARDAANRMTTVITESKSGRQAWNANVFVDATGDGDVAAQVGCDFDYGHPETGEAQPMSLMALFTGVKLDEIEEYVSGGRRGRAAERATYPNGHDPRQALLGEFERAGLSPSYSAPTIWCIYENLYALMANHEYGISSTSAEQITSATMNARAEIHELARGLRSLGGRWAQFRIVSTGAQIGVREGRRIHGRYSVSLEDIRSGQKHSDAICRVRSGADVHSLRRDEGGFLSSAATAVDGRARGDTIAQVNPYDIPLRALIARDVDGLMLAGRCISGDFYAHSSYRVTGNAVAMGQAAGTVAALAAKSATLPHAVPWSHVQDAIGQLNLICEQKRMQVTDVQRV